MAALVGSPLQPPPVSSPPRAPPTPKANYMLAFQVLNPVMARGRGWASRERSGQPPPPSLQLQPVSWPASLERGSHRIEGRVPSQEIPAPLDSVPTSLLVPKPQRLGLPDNPPPLTRAWDCKQIPEPLSHNLSTCTLTMRTKQRTHAGAQHSAWCTVGPQLMLGLPVRAQLFSLWNGQKTPYLQCKVD